MRFRFTSREVFWRVFRGMIRFMNPVPRLRHPRAIIRIHCPSLLTKSAIILA